MAGQEWKERRQEELEGDDTSLIEEISRGGGL
jgi:hypothetical protein